MRSHYKKKTKQNKYMFDYKNCRKYKISSESLKTLPEILK